LVKGLSELFPNMEWKKYTLETNVRINWNPYPYYPYPYYYQYPWCGTLTAGQTDVDNGLTSADPINATFTKAGTSMQNNTSGTYNVEIQ